ncbi:hypothetical protein SADUNF_Sadunf04G0108600 [Salix dunnii]|uniref:Uncharacterized protein n=1 Tax=Salix dunnii TaxID=1413687 RepID=A0A835KFN2_9ROSI|nr:hypothetical protein SADUNF_Sadunf04G0108600 [Salix dunnii]
MKNQQDLGNNDQKTSTHSSNNNNSQDLEEFQIQNEMQDEDGYGLALSLSFHPRYKKKKTTSNTSKPQLSLSFPPTVAPTSLLGPINHCSTIEKSHMLKSLQPRI